MFADRIEQFRQWLVIICYTLTAAIFYGFVAACLVQYVLKVEEVHALAFVGIPVGAAFAAYMLPKMRKWLGFT
jgi:hypothetical protein